MRRQVSFLSVSLSGGSRENADVLYPESLR
jgi:hypothetical protein